jgi:hypothetical protein
MKFVFSFQADTTWFESPCRKCKCKFERDIPSTQCNLKTCKTDVNPEYEMRLDWTKGVCCPEHTRTACKEGGSIYQVRNKFAA